MNQAEFARLHAVSKKTVTTWKNKGWVVLNTDGMVDVELSNKNLEQYRTIKNQTDDNEFLSVTQGNEVTETGNDSEGNAENSDEFSDYPETRLPAKELNRRLTLEKLRVERERARAAKYETEVREGVLLLASEVAQHDAEVGSQLKKKLMSLPSELAVRLSAMNSPAEVENLLRSELTNALNEFLDAYEYHDS
ncbi:MAG: hypothetical protein GAK29_00891 [Acinetobacter bereziniae]|uniref:Uncharacterized protein n=1 Tax=Acinetobacter bereziniae TaxID=106648 RepID=A0A833PHR0_ACIBZ|nr:MAG: hypothetical protein GAK29_00891 [Acinetobacter bereziniae]